MAEYRERPGAPVKKPIEESELERALERLCVTVAGIPCFHGIRLLRSFAEARPTDFAFLEPGDLLDLTTSGFAGIPEWDSFAEHYATCERCHA